MALALGERPSATATAIYRDKYIVGNRQSKVYTRPTPPTHPRWNVDRVDQTQVRFVDQTQVRFVDRVDPLGPFC